MVLVVGSQNSSNSQRLRELASENEIAAHLIDGPDEIDNAWFDNVDTVLVTAGASAPESVVQACVEHLRQQYDAKVDTRSIRDEDVRFPLPRELRSIT